MTETVGLKDGLISRWPPWTSRSGPDSSTRSQSYQPSQNAGYQYYTAKAMNTGRWKSIRNPIGITLPAMQTNHVKMESFRNKCTTNAMPHQCTQAQIMSRTRRSKHVHNGRPMYRSLCKEIDGLFAFQLLQAQALANLIANLALILRPALPPHLRGLHVGGTLIVGLSQHAHNGYEDLLDALDWRPSLRSVLVVVGVITRGVQNGDTNGSIGVN